MIHCLSFFIISFTTKPLFIFPPITEHVIYVAVNVVCCYLTLSLSEAVQIKVITTAANLLFILLGNLLQNCKTLRKVGAN